MSKIILILSILGVPLTMGLPPPSPSPVEVYAREMTRGGRLFSCSLNSCAEDVLEKSRSVACEHAKDIQHLKDITLPGFIKIVTESNDRAMKVEPNCIDPSYRCPSGSDHKLFHLATANGDAVLRVGSALECAKDLSDNDFKKVEKCLVEYQQKVAKTDIGKNVECSEVLKNELNVLSEKLEEICKPYKPLKSAQN